MSKLNQTPQQNFFLCRSHVNSYTPKVAVKSLQFIEFTNFHVVCNQITHQKFRTKEIKWQTADHIYGNCGEFFFPLGTQVFADIWVPPDQQIKSMDSLH